MAGCREKVNLMITKTASDINARLNAIEAHQTRIERKLDRLVAMFAPDGRQLDERAFLDSLAGMSVAEMVAANRERNRRIKEQRQRKETRA